MKQFTARFTYLGTNRAWTFLDIPFDVEQILDSKARVAVKERINGFAFARCGHNPGADVMYDSLSHTHPNELADCVASAKR